MIWRPEGIKEETRKLLFREIATCAQYLVISVIASYFAHWAFLYAKYGPDEPGVMSYHIDSITRMFVSAFLVPWLSIFIGLSILRLIIILLTYKLLKTNI